MVVDSGSGDSIGGFHRMTKMSKRYGTSLTDYSRLVWLRFVFYKIT